MRTIRDYQVRRLTAISALQIQQLAALLMDCVEGGASVSFMLPLAPDKAQAYWRGVADAVARGERALLVAEDASGIIGTVQLVLAQPDNQPHRADIAKMLVLRRARCGGVGAALIQYAEQLARDSGKWLLVLDTASAEAERLYQRLGWIRVGVVPDYALLPNGAFCATTFYYRKLEPVALDNPVWSALGSGHAGMAQVHGQAARYPRDVSPLVGLSAPTPQAFADLGAMVELEEELWLLTPAPLILPPQWQLVRERYIDQMVHAGWDGAAALAAATAPAAPLLELGQADVAEMMALAAVTKPGPFVQKTITMGRYLGVRAADGSLAAMSGTRMALAGFTEISAVCTSPGARGAGHARALLQTLVAQISASGKIPFLHVKTENGAKQVYEKLGFAVRREICFSVIRRIA